MQPRKKTKRIPNPQENANFVSLVTLFYTIPTFLKSLQKNIGVTDIPVHHKNHSSKQLADAVETAWNLEISVNKKPSLYSAILNVFWTDILLSGFLLVLFEVILNFRIIQIICVIHLIKCYSENESSFYYYVYASGIVLSGFFYVLIKHNYVMVLDFLAMKLRVALSSLVYKKSLRIKRNVLLNRTITDMVNLLSIDLFRCDGAIHQIHFLWVCLVEIALVYYILSDDSNSNATWGILFIFMFLPLEICFGHISCRSNVKALLKTDERVRITNQIINGIEKVKLHTWEKPLSAMVLYMRRTEVKNLQSIYFVKALIYAFDLFVPRLGQSISIIGLALMYNRISVYYVFAIVAFYFYLSNAIIAYFSVGVQEKLDLRLSIEKIQDFLLLKESMLSGNTMRQTGNNRFDIELSVYDLDNDDDLVRIVLKNVSAKWSNSSSTNTISNVSMKIIRNDIFGLVGPVGSGKTSLLHIITNQLPIISGSIETEGVISYASQDPWIFDGTIEQNIIYGEPFYNERYLSVIRGCALEKYILTLPNGDQTLVGKNGITLTLAEKVRINLARSIYKQADIYLIDDPFSFVDAYLGKHIFEECILNLLNKKCVLLVTHDTRFLKYLNTIFLMNSGTILIQGSYTVLRDSDFKFTKFFDLDETEVFNIYEQQSYRAGSLLLMDVEKTSRKSVPPEAVPSNIYMGLFNIIGSIQFFRIMLLYGLAYSFGHGTDYYLIKWANCYIHTTNNTDLALYYDEPTTSSTENYITTYIILLVLTIIFSLGASISFFNFCKTSSLKLHENMFLSVINAPMSFFHKTNVEKILVRFSDDLAVIDYNAPKAAAETLKNFYQIIAVLIVVCLVNPWMVILTGVIFFICYYLISAHLSTQQTIKKWESDARSAIISHLASCLNGLSTVRILGSESTLENQFHDYQDEHSSIWYVHISLARAFGLWLDFFITLYLGITIFSFCFSTEVNPESLGLSITQIMLLTRSFQTVMLRIVQFDAVVAALKRIIAYSALEPEPDNLDYITPTIWPTEGTIKFQSVSVRYANSSWVLNDLNFEIYENEKIGVYGRSSVGKTSLIYAICRLTETTGTISIDKIDISKISLYNLRSKMCVVSQAPLFFYGTLRQNLDPLNQFSDEDLWDALDHVHLKSFVLALPLSLRCRMYDGGSNFSVGQRQMLCLASAIIRREKIVIIDEVTASLDPQTESLIQETINKVFMNSTVIQISHRLDSIIASNRLMVIDNGEIIEFDHPYKLLSNNKSLFSIMLHNTDIGLKRKLSAVAETNYKKSRQSMESSKSENKET